MDVKIRPKTRPINFESAITVRYALSIRKEENNEWKKARHVGNGHLYGLRKYLLHRAKDIQSISVRMTLVVVQVKVSPV